MPYGRWDPGVSDLNEVSADDLAAFQHPAISTSSGTRSPPGSGDPVSRRLGRVRETSTSIVT